MAHHQWGGAQPRGDPQDPTQQFIRDLIAAMGASIVNTNNQVGLLAQQIQGVIYHGGFGGGAGGAVQGAGGANDQGYRALKPKKDMTKVTAEDAPTLMVELAQFEVDLGELGVVLEF